MTYRTYQEKQWNGNLGKKYTERNILTPHELDKLTKKDYGITMTELNNLFIGKFKRNIRKEH